MENSPAKKSFWTPAKIFLAGVFLFVAALTVPFVRYLKPLDNLIGSGSQTASIAGYQVNPEDKPVRFKIPVLNINSAVQYVGVTKDGNMDTPKSAVDVAWYKFGPPPGFPGSAVIAAHINTRYSAHGVFEHLGDLQTGDEVQVVTAGGKTLTFKVVRKEYLPFDAPSTDVFQNTTDKRLNLITCAGDWLPEKHSYNQRLVVYTQLVE